MVKRVLKSEKFIQANRLLVVITLINCFVYLFYRICFKESFFSLGSYVLPLGFAIRANKVFLILTVVLCILSFPAIIISKVKSYIIPMIYLLVIPFLCLFSVLLLDTHSITDQITFMKHKYFYITYPNLGELSGRYSLYRCDAIGRNCRTLYNSNSNYVIPLDFEINEEDDQLFIFFHWEIQYIDRGDLVPLSDVAAGYYSGYRYLASFDTEESILFLSKCNRQSMDQNCTLWSLELSNPEIDLETGYFDYGDEETLTDEDWNENYFYVDDQLIFYVTEEPICFMEGCAFTIQNN